MWVQDDSTGATLPGRTRTRLEKFLRRGRPYQRKRVEGTEERWKLISSRLDPADRSLLDVGCNVGVLTRRAAASGRFCLGLDPDAACIAEARRETGESLPAGFVRFQIDPESVAALPEFDVVLCLSVHHYWLRDFGEAEGWRVVGEIARKARRKLFFEPASVRRKFGGAELGFQDLDRESLLAYNTRNLEAAVPGARVEHLGESPCLGTEPFRLMFVVTR